MAKPSVILQDSPGQVPLGSSCTVREEINRMWMEEGVDEEDITKDNMTNDIAYQLIKRGRTGEDVDAEFATLTFDQILGKYGYILSPQIPVGTKG
jgi:hypothetical protein